MVFADIFWIATYVTVILTNMKNKSLSIPILAILFNFSWEIIFTLVYPHDNELQLYVQGIWAALDAIIVIQAVKYSKTDFPNIQLKLFIIWCLFGLGLFSTFILYFVETQRDVFGTDLAFTSNFIMSILFVTLFVRRRGSKGQSIFIAVFKLLGTMFGILFYFYCFPNKFGKVSFPILLPLTTFMDLLYLLLLIYDYLKYLKKVS